MIKTTTQQQKRTSKADARLVRLGDGISNPLLRIGQGTQNTFQATNYKPQFLTLNRMQLDWAYQSSWMCGLAIDIVAEDMTREGIEIKNIDPVLNPKFERCFDDFGIWDAVCDGIRWGRLYGGALAVILIDGDDMSKPLGKIRKDSFRGLYVFDRWQVNPSPERIQELGVDFGKPEYYQILTNEVNIEVPQGKIHHSRVIRFEGIRNPYYVRQAFLGWGSSVLERVLKKIEAFDLTSEGASQLVSKAYLRYYKVKGLRDILTNDIARKGFLKQMDYTRQFQGIEGMTLGDADDSFQTFSYQFSGLPEILIQFGQQISGALGIPLVRLFGQSPVGFNSTGEIDLRLYYDEIRRQQDSKLRLGMKKLINVMYQSIVGSEPRDDFTFEFRPLWQMTDSQKSEAASSNVSSIISALDAGVLSLPNALRELKRLSETVGIFGSISEEDIKAAESAERDDAPPKPEELDDVRLSASENEEYRTMVPSAA